VTPEPQIRPAPKPETKPEPTPAAAQEEKPAPSSGLSTSAPEKPSPASPPASAERPAPSDAPKAAPAEKVAPSEAIAQPAPEAGLAQPSEAVAQPAPEAAPANSKQAESVQAGKTQLRELLKAPVTVQYEGRHLADILTLLSETYAVNFAIDWRVVAPPQDKPAQEAVAQKSRPGLGLRPKRPPRDSQLARRVTDGVVAYVFIEDVPMEDILKALLRPLNLIYSVQDSVVWVTSPAALESDGARFEPPTASSSQALAEILKAPVSIEFTNNHIQDILQFLSVTYSVNFMLDQRVVQPAQDSESAEKPKALGSPGYVTNGVVPSISLTDVPMREALALVLRSLDLTYRVDQGYIWISSPDLIDEPPLPAEQVQPDVDDAQLNIAPSSTGAIRGGGIGPAPSAFAPQQEKGTTVSIQATPEGATAVKSATVGGTMSVTTHVDKQTKVPDPSAQPGGGMGSARPPEKN
jgi:hypothetical protein